MLPDEYQSSEVFVTRDKNSPLFAGATEQYYVPSARQSKLIRRDNIMAESALKVVREEVNVLVEQESHESAATCISSLATMSMAY